jgi:hypothetical protein
MSRACNVSYEECNDPNHVCQFVEETDIKKFTDVMFDKVTNNMDAKELKQLKKETSKSLHKLSSNPVDNAFNNVNFGGDIFGI